MNKNIQKANVSPTSMEVAVIMSKTDMIPKSYKGKPEDIFVCAMFGQSIGLNVMQALQNISVINGRPALWGDSVLSLILSHPDFEDIIEEDDGSTATCTIKRAGMSPHSVTFSMQDATNAGLLKKPGPWQQYPKRMRQMRARAFAARDTFADALGGISVREEIEDYPDTKNDSSVGSTDKGRVEFIKEQVRSQTVQQIEQSPETFPPSSAIAFEVVPDVLLTNPPQYAVTAAAQILLQEKIKEFKVSDKIVGKWIAKAKCSGVRGLTNEQAERCLDFIEKNYPLKTENSEFEKPDFLNNK